VFNSALYQSYPDASHELLLTQHGPWSHPCTVRRVALGYGTCSTVCAPDDFYHLDRLQRLAYLALHSGAPLARAWESVG
jgi:hypothetical protein